MKLFSTEVIDKPSNASRDAMDFAINLICFVFLATIFLNSQKISYSLDDDLLFIWKILFSLFLISEVIYLSSLVSVCLLIQCCGAKLTFDLFIEM